MVRDTVFLLAESKKRRRQAVAHLPKRLGADLVLEEELLDFLKSLDGFLGSAGPQKFVGKKAPHEKPLLGIGWRKRSPAQCFRAAGVGPLERLEVDIIRNAFEALGHGLRTIRASFLGIVRIGLAGEKQ